MIGKPVNPRDGVEIQLELQKGKGLKAIPLTPELCEQFGLNPSSVARTVIPCRIMRPGVEDVASRTIEVPKVVPEFPMPIRHTKPSIDADFAV